MQESSAQNETKARMIVSVFIGAAIYAMAVGQNHDRTLSIRPTLNLTQA